MSWNPNSRASFFALRQPLAFHKTSYYNNDSVREYWSPSWNQTSHHLIIRTLTQTIFCLAQGLQNPSKHYLKTVGLTIGPLAQLARAHHLQWWGQGFESLRVHSTFRCAFLLFITSWLFEAGVSILVLGFASPVTLGTNIELRARKSSFNKWR